MYHTYILYSEKIQKYYTGQTANLANRLQEHNQGETPSIKIGIPWVIIWSHRFMAMRWCRIQSANVQ